MKTYVGASLCIFLLAACGERATPREAFSQSSDPHRAGVIAPKSCSPLPAKVVLDFPHHLQSDYYYINVKKMVRRSVVMQYLRDDTEKVNRQLRDAMLSAGFKFYDSRPTGDGGTHLRFSLKGYGMAHVILQPAGEVSDEGDSVVMGTMTFDLPPPQFNPPAKVKKKPATAAKSG